MLAKVPCVCMRTLFPPAIVALFALTITLAFYTIFSITPQVHAEENQPDAPGSISGVVTNSAGEPLAGIGVTLLQKQNNGSYQPAVAETVTAADGSYRIALLEPAIYLVRFHDPNYNYGPEYYNNVTEASLATEIPIAGNRVTGIDAILALGSRIRGRLSAVDDLSLDYIDVSLYERTEEYYSGWQIVSNTALTSTTTNYQFTGLTSGIYRVCASAIVEALGHRYECFDDAAAIERATNITVTLGVTVSDINFVFGDGADLVEIAGRVRDLAGTPLPDIDVHLAPIPTATPPPTAIPAGTNVILITPLPPGPTPHGAATPQAVAPANVYPYPYASSYMTTTTAGGDYGISSIEPGEYLLSFRDSDGTYASEYYLDVLFPEDAQVLSLAPHAKLTIADVQLGPAGQISGVVTVLGEVSPSATIHAYLNAGNSWVEIAMATADQQTGQYLLRGLPAGVYRLGAYGSSIGASYQAFYPDSETIADATDLSIAVGGSRSGINFDLSNGPTYERSISGQVTADGEPQAGIRVNLQYGCCSLRPVTYTFTDENGAYHLGGLDQGFWTVGFVDPTGIYARIFAGNQPTLERADGLSLVQTVQTLTANVELRRGGAIHGEIRTNNREAVPGIRIYAYLMIDGGPHLVAEDTVSTSDGTYALNGLYPGIYRLCYNDANNSTPPECYGASNQSSVYMAQDIPVEAEQTTTNINLTWGPDYTIYLPSVARQQD